MTHFKCWPLVILLGLTACSGPDPVAPVPESESTEKSGPEAMGEPIGHYIHANREAMSRRTIQNAHKVERAVWRFAADNEGMVPSYIYDFNLVDKTLFDYLPGKQQLKNPFTGSRDQPVDEFANHAGDVGYLTIMDMGYIIGFQITARGADDDQILEIRRYLDNQGSENRSVRD